MTTSLTIAEAAARAGLTPDALRYYERSGLLLKPVSRGPSGHRLYAESDLRWLRLITQLRATGMPIRRLKEYAELARAGAGTEARRMALLEDHRAVVVDEIDAMQDALGTIDRKLAIYRAAIAGGPGSEGLMDCGAHVPGASPGVPACGP